MLVSKFEMPELVPHLRRAVRFIKHKAGDYGVESEYIEFEDTNHSPTIEQAKRGVSEALRWFKSIEGPKETGQGIERQRLRLTHPKLKFISCFLIGVTVTETYYDSPNMSAMCSNLSSWLHTRVKI
jgi:hypothetical protein